MLAKIASPFLLADKAVDQRLELAFKALAPASKMPVARRRT
jgi:hypothetical protein